MKIGLHQLIFSDNKRENLKKIVTAIEGSDADLDVFPEYAMGVSKGGVTREFVEKTAEPLEGPFISEIIEKTRELGKNAVFTAYLKEGESIFNAALLAEKGNVNLIYRKIHLFDAYGYRESDVFTSGTRLAIKTVGSFKVGLAVCFDLRFPELFRAMAYKGVELFIVPASWYRGKYKHVQWLALTAARAHENLAFLVAVNQTGEIFSGRSLVATPMGHILVDLGEDEKSLTIDIYVEEVKKARRLVPTLNLARTDLYRKWI